MVEGEDYGRIPGTPKPTLFKPGAEKLCDVYGFSKQVEVLNRIEDWDAAFFAYEVRVTPESKRTGLVEAQGLGSANTKEKRYRNQDAFSLVNTVLKMAKKRALVDAVLSATRSSGIFTQDVEERLAVAERPASAWLAAGRLALPPRSESGDGGPRGGTRGQMAEPAAAVARGEPAELLRRAARILGDDRLAGLFIRRSSGSTEVPDLTESQRSDLILQLDCCELAERLGQRGELRRRLREKLGVASMADLHGSELAALHTDLCTKAAAGSPTVESVSI